MYAGGSLAGNDSFEPSATASSSSSNGLEGSLFDIAFLPPKRPAEGAKQIVILSMPHHKIRLSENIPRQLGRLLATARHRGDAVFLLVYLMREDVKSFLALQCLH
jgi:hypothetical protein